MASPAAFLAEPKQREHAAIIDAIVVVLLAGFLDGVCDMLNLQPRLGALIGCAGLIYQFTFVAYREGRTLGRELQNICIVGDTGEPISAFRALSRSVARMAPFFFINGRPVTESIAQIVIILQFFVDYGLVTAWARRQTIGDLVARTLVIKLPPLQPHRAPSGPMFSASDREFGIPPRWHEDRERR